MALGYDWLYNVLSPSLRSQVYGQLNNWISFFDSGGFGHGHPHGNYFAGYYAAKAYAGLATEGDNANAAHPVERLPEPPAPRRPGSARLRDGLPHRRAGLLQQLPGRRRLVGRLGLRARRHREHGPAQPGREDGQGDRPRPGSREAVLLPAWTRASTSSTSRGLRAGTWTTATLLHTNGNDPARASRRGRAPPCSRRRRGCSRRWNNALAPQYHLYAREVRAQVGLPAPWTDFSSGTTPPPSRPYTTLPRSFFARGAELRGHALRLGHRRGVGLLPRQRLRRLRLRGRAGLRRGCARHRARRDAVPRQQELPGHDAGRAPSTTRARSTTRSGAAGTPRRIYNTFYNGTAGGPDRPERGLQPRPPPRGSAATRTGTAMCSVRGSGLQDAYRSTSGVTSWTRDVVYLRPRVFVTVRPHRRQPAPRATST